MSSRGEICRNIEGDRTGAAKEVEGYPGTAALGISHGSGWNQGSRAGCTSKFGRQRREHGIQIQLGAGLTVTGLLAENTRPPVRRTSVWASGLDRRLILPEALEPIRAQLCVSDRVGDVLVSEVMLNRSRVLPVVRQLKPSRVPEHVWVDRKTQIGRFPGSRDDLPHSRFREWPFALAGEHVGALRKKTGRSLTGFVGWRTTSRCFLRGGRFFKTLTTILSSNWRWLPLPHSSSRTTSAIFAARIRWGFVPSLHLQLSI